MLSIGFVPDVWTN